MRTISAEGYQPVAVSGDTGPAPMLQWVPIEQLVVDDAYQRPIAPQGRRNVQSIAQHFRWPKFAPVVVAPVEGGRYAVIDGQHRATAALLRGLAQVPCMIVPVDRRGQAEAFGAINGRVTRLTAVQLHRAAVSAGDPAALAIEAACKSAGVQITHSSTLSVMISQHGSAPNRTASVGAVAKQLAQHGEATLVLSLRAIILATADGSLLTGQVIGAVCRSIHDAPRWRSNEPRLLAVFETTDLGEMLVKARSEALRTPGVDTGSHLQRKLVARLTGKLGASE